MNAMPVMPGPVMPPPQRQAEALTEGALAMAGGSAAATSPVLPIDLAAGLQLDHALARSLGEELSAQYCFAEPFPHIVLENFLPPDVAQLAVDHFPAESLKSDRVFEIGYAGHNKRQILPAECDAQARQLFHFFNSQPMLAFLEGLTAIQGLISDPYFAGGGFHETGRGGKLGIHADFRVNEQLHLHRRINVIIYLNEHWEAAYGGNLELWSRDMKEKRREVAPLFNRCVVFNTDATSYHGHPDPLTVPEGVHRRSIALYYYTASKEIYNEVPNTSTIYHARPGDDRSTQREAWDLRLDQHLRQWMPPALLRYAYAIKRALRAR
jgi:hypothetical protein